jgi:hypothetical protein
MELTSMLAEETFSDHPLTACPVVGSLLRAYNDSIDDRHRQDLYVYAAKMVGSRGGRNVERARQERLAAWGLERLQRRWTRFVIPVRCRKLANTPDIESIGQHVVNALGKQTRATHREVLALIDELLAIGVTGAQIPAVMPFLPQRGAGAARHRAGARVD